MSFYILTLGISYEAQELILFTDTLDAAKAAAAADLAAAKGFRADCYTVYEATVGSEPQVVAEASVWRIYSDNGSQNTLGSWD